MTSLSYDLQVAVLDVLSDAVPAGLRQRYLDHTALVEAVLAVVQDPARHHYLSTGCLHGNHGYCRGEETCDGRTKTPAQCKFCAAPCECACHRDARIDPAEPVSGA